MQRADAGLSLDPCTLCPRMCGAQRTRGQRGVCGAAGDMVAARAALHYWEEPVLSGTQGSGTVFFTGCPLQCVYCQNFQLARNEAGWVVTVEQLADACLSLQDQGALNINFVTPTHYTPQIIEAVYEARRKGLRLPIVWNTSSYERVETIQALSGVVDVYLADYKYASSHLAQRYSRASDYPQVALKAIEEMLRQVGQPCYRDTPDGPVMTQGVIVRHLVLPDALDNSFEALKLLWRTFGSSVRYSIMNQYTPAAPASVLQKYASLAHAVTNDQYEEVLSYADELGIQDYFWQEGGAAEESFIPAWDGQGL